MANEVQFLFCTISFRGFCETRQKVEELKAMREAYTNELQRLKANFLFLFFDFVKYEYCTFLSDVSSPLPSDPDKSASAILVFAEPNMKYPPKIYKRRIANELKTYYDVFTFHALTVCLK
jgi:hypothetical protein